MDKITKEIHAEAREATARQTYKAIIKTDHQDIAIALILRAIDEWYQKGIIHGTSGKERN